MGFGRKFKQYPTPSNVVFWSKIIQRLVGTGIGVMALLPETLPTKIITIVLGGFIAISREFEDFFGVKVTGPIDAEDVEVLKDDTGSTKK